MGATKQSRWWIIVGSTLIAGVAFEVLLLVLFQFWIPPGNWKQVLDPILPAITKTVKEHLPTTMHVYSTETVTTTALETVTPTPMVSITTVEHTVTITIITTTSVGVQASHVPTLLPEADATIESKTGPAIPNALLKLPINSIPAIGSTKCDTKSTEKWINPGAQVAKQVWKQHARYLRCPFRDKKDLCHYTRYHDILKWRWRTPVVRPFEVDTKIAPKPDNNKTIGLAGLLRTCLKEKTIGISGDSVTRQSLHSLLCILHNDFPNSNITMENIVDESLGKLDEYKVFIPPSTRFRILWTSNDLNPYLVAYSGKRPQPILHFDQLHPSLELLKAQNPDFLVLNTGLWLDPSSWNVTEMDFLQAYKNIVVSVLSHHLSEFQGRILFRNTPIRHLHYAPNESKWSCRAPNPTSGRCITDYAHAFAEHTQNELLVEVVKYVNIDRSKRKLKHVKVLDAASVAWAREDGHIHPEVDCSHYCLPGVPDSWTMTMLSMMWDDCRYSSK